MTDTTYTLEDLREALATVQRMGGAEPAWKRANRIARTYALQNGISIGQALKEAKAVKKEEIK